MEVREGKGECGGRGGGEGNEAEGRGKDVLRVLASEYPAVVTVL